MKCKIFWWISPVLVLISGFAVPQNVNSLTETKKWVVNENSSLAVNGSTNINKFSCEIPSCDKIDTLTISTGKNSKDVELSGDVVLSIKSFDCHSSAMTHELRKTLKESEFPNLRITFLSLNKLPNLSLRPEPITGLVDIDIAGVRKRFEVSYQITESAQKVIQLVGTRDINFSDFTLVPPRKLGGMIQTKDKLSVEFRLMMRCIN
jgi:hypothetical protein